jgi:hypothetical protein
MVRSARLSSRVEPMPGDVRLMNVTATLLIVTLPWKCSAPQVLSVAKAP